MGRHLSQNCGWAKLPVGYFHSIVYLVLCLLTFVEIISLSDRGGKNGHPHVHGEILALKKEAKVIMSDRNHALSMCYELLPSGRRCRCLKVKPRAQKSFIPYSIRLLNSTS